MRPRSPVVIVTDSHRVSAILRETTNTFIVNEKMQRELLTNKILMFAIFLRYSCKSNTTVTKSHNLKIICKSGIMLIKSV